MNLLDDLALKDSLELPEVLYRRSVYCYTAATAILMNNACIVGNKNDFSEETLDNVEETSVMLYDIFLKAALIELATSDKIIESVERQVIDNLVEYADLYDLIDKNTCFMHATNGTLRELVRGKIIEKYGNAVIDSFNLVLNENSIYKSVIIDCTISICAFLCGIDGDIASSEKKNVSSIVVKYFG